MKFRLINLLAAALIVSAFTACTKAEEEEPIKDPTNDEPVGGPSPTTKNTVVLRFTNSVNGHDLDQTGNTFYASAAVQAFNVKQLKYYISNVTMINESGGTFNVSGIYHLVNEQDILNTQYVYLNDVPNGNYTGVRFTIGVDSAAANGPQTGDLNPAKGMYWNPSSGYMAFLMEGETHVTGVPSYSFHVGGYATGQSALRTATVNFNGTVLAVDGAHWPGIPHIYTEVKEILTNPVNINFTTMNNINGPGADSQMLADNYADMFYFIHLD